MDKERVDTLLKGLLDSDELVSLWWNSQNRFFGYETPAFIWEREPKRVINYILEQFVY